MINHRLDSRQIGDDTLRRLTRQWGDCRMLIGGNEKSMQSPYLDFDLALELTDGDWSSHVNRSPAGEGSSPFQISLTENDLNQFWEDVGRAGVDVGLSSPRAVGEQLYKAVFGQELSELWHAGLAIAYRNRQRLRLRLFGTDVPEMRDLPWEYLYDPTREEYLALSMQSPMARYMGLRHQIRPLPVQSPLRVLVVIPGPNSMPEIQADRRWLRMIDSLDYLAVDGTMIFERLEKPTLLDLQRRLRQGTYHALHFIGYAGDRSRQDGELILEDEMGRSRTVSGLHLGALLRDHYSLRLVTLTTPSPWSQETALTMRRVASSLVMRGIPASVAFPFEMPAEVERIWLQEFLPAVASLMEIEVAVAEARNAVLGEVGSALWGAPVLYSRAPDGRIFVSETDSGPDAALQPAGKESLLSQVLSALAHPGQDDSTN